ncbi:MAG: START domain-containing protein, partial [bacterium]
ATSRSCSRSPVCASRAIGLLALCTTLLAGAPARSDDGWQPLVTQDGVSVRERASPDRALPELQAEAEIDAGIFEVLAVITDVPKQTQWLHDCVEARIVRVDSPDRALIYNRTGESWPISDRDVVLRTEATLLEPGTHAAVHFTNVEDPAAPPVEGVVRMPRLTGTYDLISLSPTRTRVIYGLDADPGGSVPTFATVRFARDTPLHTLLGLRKQVLATEGQYAAFVAQWSARR